MLKGSVRKSVVLGVAIAVVLAVPWMASAQEQKTPDQPAVRAVDPKTEKRTVGEVVAVSRASVVLKTDEGRYAIYSITPSTFKGKQPVTIGSRASVITAANDTADAPTALAIDVMAKPQGLAPSAATAEDNVPVQIRTLESQIAKQAQRYHAGFMLGSAIDPELISLNAFAAIGPIFSRSVHFRPGVEFAWGEVTTLFALNLDGIFTLPSMTSARWAPYVGVGPNFAFSHRGFSSETDTTVQTDQGEQKVDRFDFGDFSWNNGLNFIIGVKNPSGMSLELRATAYSVSSIRVLGGFTF